MTRVLVIDDDRKLCRLLQEYLIREGMTVHLAHDGRSGLRSALSGQHDLVVLDLALPELTGLQVIKELRESSEVGVVLLTAGGEEVDRIIGLECGADDYLAKPFNPRELLARIRAISRRLKPAFPCELVPEPECLAIGDLALDEGTRTCRRNGEDIHLTTAEFNLLSVFLRRRGRVIHREELSKQVLGREYSPFDRSIDVHVSNLRRKLGALPDGTKRIRGVRSIGYIYVRSAAHPSLVG
jgi:two-component system response regulator CpxR